LPSLCSPADVTVSLKMALMFPLVSSLMLLAFFYFFDIFSMIILLLVVAYSGNLRFPLSLT
jgi:hypothetical protein